NANLNVAAFVPSIAIADDGTFGVTYFDFRSNTASATTLPTDYWLARSTDGHTWREVHVAGPFDLATAPNAAGLFLGDYQGLATAGSTFLTLFAQSVGEPDNRTDIFFGSFPGTASSPAS